MTMIPIASFLAGSILTLVLPIGLLIALGVWYQLTVRSMPEAGRGRRPRAGTQVAPLAPDPVHAEPAPAVFETKPTPPSEPSAVRPPASEPPEEEQQSG